MAVYEDQARGSAAFAELESEVRSYCRSWPAMFDRAAGSWLYDESGNRWLDWFCGAGTLSYGHNHPLLREVLIDYLSSERIVHSLDMFTTAKHDFLVAFDRLVLRPRGLEYRLQFPGPAGTNAVEAALKLARKVTGRRDVACFSNAFHGVSLGALAVTANAHHRGAAGVPLEHAVRLPFDPGASGEASSLEFAEAVLGGAGDARPAAVIVETVQGEGGVNAATDSWLRGLAGLCRRHEVILIVDDVQMGCGRTGPFFSFETAGIEPDIVCMSKAISGFGLPMALTLIRPELDVWAPGEHNGTFRGFNPAFVTATAALEAFWQDDTLEQKVARQSARLAGRLAAIAQTWPELGLTTRGRGFAQGLAFESGELAGRAAAAAFEIGLLVERAGPEDEVVKLLPPLTLSEDELGIGLDLLERAVAGVAH